MLTVPMEFEIGDTIAGQVPHYFLKSAVRNYVRPSWSQLLAAIGGVGALRPPGSANA